MSKKTYYVFLQERCNPQGGMDDFYGLHTQEEIETLLSNLRNDFRLQVADIVGDEFVLVAEYVTYNNELKLIVYYPNKGGYYVRKMQ